MSTKPTFTEIKCPNMAKSQAGLKQLAALSGEGSCLQAIKSGFRSWGETLKTKKILPRTPKAADGGHLRSSIRVTPSITGNRAKLEFFAGGVSAPYAVAVHEHLSEYSPPSWQPPTVVQWTTPSTGPKYIESAIREDIDQLDDVVSEYVNKAISKVMPK